MVKQTRVYVLGIAFAISLCGLGGVVASSMRAQAVSHPVADNVGAGFSAPGYSSSNVPGAYGGTTSWTKSSNVATWTISSLSNGTYDVYTTWFGTSSFTTKALYRATAGTTVEMDMNQSQPLAVNSNVGGKWAKIGTVTVSNGTIVVTVRNNQLCPQGAPNSTPHCYVQADAVMAVLTQASASGSSCGDGQVQAGEECDDGNQTNTDACTTQCKNARCGDTWVQYPAEECDDGNQIAADGCTNACKTPSCGDGVVQPLSWQPEQCDDGNQSSEDACTNECKLPRCGDGFKNGMEQCDNGAVGGPSCGPTCRLTVCGDRRVEGLEYCDDGNALSGDGCSAQCVTEAPAGSDTQSLQSAALSCENGTSYVTVKYTKNHANCVFLKKNGQEFMYNYQSFCDGPLNAVATAKMELKENIVVQPGDKLKVCHPMLFAAPWGCSGEVAVTGSSCAPTPPVCGNGKKEGAEECDDGNQSNTDNCTNVCKNQRCGDGFYNPGLEFCDDGNDNDLDACDNRCLVQKCGDGKVQTKIGEECDDGYQDNTDACTSLCKVAKCGDGFVKKPSSNMSYAGYELCDDGNTVNGDGCSAQCTLEAVPVCGNGRKEGSEQCDDGNMVNGDGCSTTCTTQAITVGCGNGKIDPGEICDNGTNNVSFLTTQYGYCTTQCRPSGLSICGNGTIQGTEQCDDGNSIDTDACRNNCMLPTACGNGKKEGQEQCDDGNRNDNDACTNACNNAKCLDGIVWANVEGCDDGNNINSDACSNVCMPKPVCGNGFQDFGEQCDDGNRIDIDSCKNDCTKPATTTVPPIPASCGNWVFDAGEQCDMGGVRTPIPNNATLCCTAACRVESCGATPAASCGNGVREGTEQCDDGNRVDTDVCRNNCTTNANTTVVLTLENVTLAPLSRTLALNRPEVAMRFKATTKDKAVTFDFSINELGVNIERGLANPVLREYANGSLTGRTWNVSAVLYFNDITVPANSTREYEIVVTPRDYQRGSYTYPPEAGPFQFDLSDYVYATTTVGSTETIHQNVARNGTCAAANGQCTIAVTTGPTPSLTFGTAPSQPRCGDGIVNQANEQCDDGNAIDSDQCKNNCTSNNVASAAALTIRNVDMGAAPHGLVTKGSVPALRFTATAGAQNAVINGLRFTAREGNIARGVFAVLTEKQTNDAAGAFYPGRYWYADAPSQLGQAAFVFKEPITVLANTTKTFEVELYMNCCNDFGGTYEPYNFTPVENTPVGPVRVDFDTATANYVTASKIVNGAPVTLQNIATNGACAAGNCAISVTTGPTRTIDVRHAGNLTVTGEGGAAAAQVAAGAESPVLLRMKLRMSNHENGRLDILPFSVQGAQAVESLSITVDGRTVTPATARECGYLAPYSAYERDTQGDPRDGVNRGNGASWYYQWLGGGDVDPTNQFCTFFDSSRGSEILPRDKDVIVEVRAKIKPRSSQWTSGTRVKVNLIQNEHYLYALGETSGTPLRPKNPTTTGGNVTYAGTLVSNEITAQ